MAGIDRLVAAHSWPAACRVHSGLPRVHSGLPVDRFHSLRRGCRRVFDLVCGARSAHLLATPRCQIDQTLNGLTLMAGPCRRLGRDPAALKFGQTTLARRANGDLFRKSFAVNPSATPLMRGSITTTVGWSSIGALSGMDGAQLAAENSLIVRPSPRPDKRSIRSCPSLRAGRSGTGTGPGSTRSTGRPGWCLTRSIAGERGRGGPFRRSVSACPGSGS